MIPWRKAWQSTPVFLSGDSHGWRISWTEKPGGIESTGLHRAGQTEVTEHAHTVALYLYFKSASKKVDRAGSSKEPESMPSVGPGVSEIATFPPITDKLRLFHLPHSLLPPISNSSCLYTWWQSLYASCCTLLLYFLRYCTVRFKIFSLFLEGCFVFLCIICVKSIINLLQHSTV